jgi:MerR family transcriptional regulator, light-induced transcriptional regulator
MGVIIMTSFGRAGDDARADAAVLSISEVSRRTGIPVAGLRNWEQRYGLPRPQRSPSGQRRYTEADCDLLTEVLRRREAGLSLSAAMAQATASTGESTGDDAGEDAGQSIFAGTRRRHPTLRVHVLDKAILLAVTRAIEDECAARAQRPILVGSFQRQRFYQASTARWADLARAAQQTVVFADFERSRPGRVAEVAVPEDSPLRREWTLICDAPDTPACVMAWERPGQEALRDRDRTFEMVWSVDPQVVRTAARISVGLAAAVIPELPERIAGRLSGDPGPSSADLRRASGLIERTLDYVSRALPGGRVDAGGDPGPGDAGDVGVGGGGERVELDEVPGDGEPEDAADDQRGAQVRVLATHGPAQVGHPLVQERAH